MNMITVSNIFVWIVLIITIFKLNRNIRETEKKIEYFLNGYDPGVNFKMIYQVEEDILIIAVSNEDSGTTDACKAIEKALVEEFETI